MKKLVAFDLDGTLAPSKAAIDAEMAALLVALLDVVQVAVISGAGMPQFQEQILAHLPDVDAKLEHLVLLPTCGTRFYRYDGGWRQLYAEDFSPEQKRDIVKALEDAVTASGFRAQQTWGDEIEDRESQITYSALGQDAPLDAKKLYDPDFSKRQRIKALVDPVLSGYSVRLGGSTSIDVTLPGIDKAYGIRKMRDILNVPTHEMIYVGDALFPGGNDAPARETGAVCIAVRDPGETKRVIETVIACATDGP